MPFLSTPQDVHAAVESGNLRALQDLIASGVDVNSLVDEPANQADMTALMVAAEAGHAPLVQPLLAAGAVVNVTNSNGSTALMYAAEFGHTNVVQALLAAGADLQAVNDWGMTALTIACCKGFTPTVQALVAAGANIHAAEISACRSGYTPLMIAAANGLTATVMALTAAGADVHAAAFGNDAGATALHLAAAGEVDGYWDDAAAFGNDTGVTALHLAADCGHTTTVQALLAAGADHSRISAKGHTPLMAAAIRGHTATVAALLAAGADVNQANSIGETALHAAAKQCYAGTVRVLLAAGANTDGTVNGKSTFGEVCRSSGCRNRDSPDVIVKAMLPYCSPARLAGGLLLAITDFYGSLRVPVSNGTGCCLSCQPRAKQQLQWQSCGRGVSPLLPEKSSIWPCCMHGLRKQLGQILC